MIQAAVAWKAVKVAAAAVPAKVWYLLGALAIIVGLWLAHRDAVGDAREDALLEGKALGKAEVRAQWDKAIASANRSQANRIGRRNIITKTVDVRTVKEIEYVYAAADQLALEFRSYVPKDNDTCVLSGGYRLYHDAAASDAARSAPDPATVRAAPSVAADTFADTVAINYRNCKVNARRLNAWNDWYDELEADQRKRVDSTDPPE
jgi:hypothetical protein